MVVPRGAALGRYRAAVGERTSYEPGTFCWTDLAARDAAEASGFYSGLFGWESEEIPGSGGYLLMRRDGAVVCGIHAMGAGAAPGVLPSWTSYVSVEDAAATAARVAGLGGRVVREPVAVEGLGSSAIVADPQGARFGLWQPDGFIGAQRVNDVGAMVLNQLNTPDPMAAAAFYIGLFPWEISQVAPDPAPYWGITNRGSLNGGMMRQPPPAPPNWLVYFTSEDLDGSDALIVNMGGEAVVPPMDIQSGRIMVARDPWYAFFALFEGAVDP